MESSGTLRERVSAFFDVLNSKWPGRHFVEAGSSVQYRARCPHRLFRWYKIPDRPFDHSKIESVSTALPSVFSFGIAAARGRIVRFLRGFIRKF